MKTINLRDFNKTLYDHDAFCEVPDEVAELLILLRRREESYQRKKYRYKAHYSLDCDDGIENEAVSTVPSAEEIYLRYIEHLHLFRALQSLTEKQFRRLYLYSVLGMSYTRIAKIENVSDVAVKDCIERTISKLKKLL